MIAHIGTALAVLAIGVAAQTTQPDMQPLKEQRGLCQAAVPADATVVAGYIAQGPKGTYSANLEHEGSEKFEGSLIAAQLEEFHYSKAFENTATRLWVEIEAARRRRQSRHLEKPERLPDSLRAVIHRAFICETIGESV